MLPELLGLHAKGLSAKAAGLTFFLFTDVGVGGDAQVAGELRILDRNQRAEGEPLAMAAVSTGLP